MEKLFQEQKLINEFNCLSLKDPIIMQVYFLINVSDY